MSDWAVIRSSPEYFEVEANPKTGEIRVTGEDWVVFLDCETFRAIYLELERKGMYDG